MPAVTAGTCAGQVEAKGFGGYKEFETERLAIRKAFCDVTDGNPSQQEVRLSVSVAVAVAVSVRACRSAVPASGPRRCCALNT
eukprot:3229258-Rhodomonas_salina.1